MQLGSQVQEKTLAKERTYARVKAAVKAVEIVKKELEEAVRADALATEELNKVSQLASQQRQIDRIQAVVQEYYHAVQTKDMIKAKETLAELLSMDVKLNMVDFSWTATGGLKGDAIAVPTQKLEEVTQHQSRQEQIDGIQAEVDDKDDALQKKAAVLQQKRARPKIIGAKD